MHLRTSPLSAGLALVAALALGPFSGWQAEARAQGTGTIEGHVLQADGVTGVAGADVLAIVEDTVLVASSTTDTDGKFTLTVESGIYAVIAVVGEELHAVQEGVSVVEGQTTIVNLLPMNPDPDPGPGTVTGTITGRVLEADGMTGVPGADVIAVHSDTVFAGAATSGPDGGFQIAVAQGVYTVIASVGIDFHGLVEDVAVADGGTTAVDILPMSMPPMDFGGLPYCADDASGSCIVSLTGGSSLSEQPMPVVFETGGLIQVQIWGATGDSDLGLIGGTPSNVFTLVLQLRAFTPRLLLGAGGSVNWSISPSGDFTEVSIQVSPIPVQRIPDVDYDNWPEGDADQATQASLAEVSLAIASLDEMPPEQRDLLIGTILATDAQAFSDPQYSPAHADTAASLSIFLAGPHLTVNGSTNSGFFEAFLPAALVDAWGVTDPSQLSAAYEGAGGLSAWNAGSGMGLRLDLHYSSGEVRISANLDATSFEEVASLPGRFELRQNYPNPFNPTSRIDYVLAENDEVRLEVFDALGRRVAVLADDMRGAGLHTATFDAHGLPSGTYFYRLTAGDYSETRPMLLVK